VSSKTPTSISSTRHRRDARTSAPYLYRIAAKSRGDFSRKAKIRLRYAGEASNLLQCGGSASPEAAAGDVKEFGGPKPFFSNCPRPAARPFSLNRIEELSHAEIAKRLGVSVRTIDRYMQGHWLILARSLAADTRLEARAEARPF